MCGKEKLKWRVLYTKSRQEKKVAKLLSEMGIVYYLPTQKVLKQWSDRKKKVEEVLFKSYVFVNLDARNYYEALKVPGVVKYVSFEGKAVSISEKQIETIKDTINNELEFEISTEYFKKGDLLTIKKGPLKGATGEVVSWSGKKRLLVRITEIGYSLVVHLPLDDLLG
jgi:transcriptional antiterminator RfaH